MNILIPLLTIIAIAVLLKYIMNVVLFNEALVSFNKVLTKNRIFSQFSRSFSVKKRMKLLKHQQRVSYYLQSRLQTMQRFAFLPKQKAKLSQAADIYANTFSKFVEKKKK